MKKFFVALAIGSLGCSSESAPRPVLVLAASSLYEPLTAAAASFEASTEIQLELSFAASNVLSVQLERGGAADLFVSASPEHVQRLIDRGLVLDENTYELWTTELALIAGASGDWPDGAPAQALAAAKRVAIGDVGVPVGEYARQSLRWLGHQSDMQDRIVGFPNEASVLQAVATGACELGLVYAASARAGGLAERVRIVATLSPKSHSPIRYRAAIPTASERGDDALQLLMFLTAGPGATPFVSAGWTPPVAQLHR